MGKNGIVLKRDVCDIVAICKESEIGIADSNSEVIVFTFT